MHDLKLIYQELLKRYGPQGWWPLLDVRGSNPTKTGSIKGYHPNDYSYPHNEQQKFEICIGAILTQNTAWPNVEKALRRLKRIRAIDPNRINAIDIDKLKEAIRPAGYYNVKAEKLKKFAEFFLELDGITPTRNQLLDVWGVGPETADSILLYAYKVPTFVVDAYTKRLFADTLAENATYDEIKEFFESRLKKDLIMYQEYHALIVEHAKRKKDLN